MGRLCATQTARPSGSGPIRWASPTSKKGTQLGRLPYGRGTAAAPRRAARATRSARPCSSCSRPAGDRRCPPHWTCSWETGCGDGLRERPTASDIGLQQPGQGVGRSPALGGTPSRSRLSVLPDPALGGLYVELRGTARARSRSWSSDIISSAIRAQSLAGERSVGRASLTWMAGVAPYVERRMPPDPPSAGLRSIRARGPCVMDFVSRDASG